MNASYLIFRLSMMANESEPSKPYPQKFSCYVHVRLENVSDHNITIATRPEDFVEKLPGKEVLYGFYISTFEKRPLRPSFYRFEPITLAPGEIAELPQTYRVGTNEATLAPAKVVYKVAEQFGAMLGVWSGRLEVVPTNEVPLH